MPILYPSQSPISTAQLSQILPWRPSRVIQFILGLLPILVTIILFEILLTLDINLLDQYAVIAVILLLATVVFTAFRYGAYSGVVSGLIASIYLAYSISPPEQLFSYSQDLAINLVIICLLYLGLALATGYLRGRIDQSLFQVNIARAYAEEQQNRLEAILGQLPIGVVITDAHTDQVIYYNHQSQNILDSKGLESNNTTISQLLSTIDSSDTDRSSHEMTSQLPNGQLTHWRVNIGPIYDMQNQRVSNVATFLDITQQKQIEQRKDDFISIASHELKTPVTSLKIYLQLMARQNIVKANSELSEIVTKANSQINKLTRLMSDLLDVSQIQTGKSGYRPRWLSLNNLTRDVVTSLKPSSTHKLMVKGKLDRQVWADPEKITQVITNLINNALKFSDEHQPIVIHLEQLEDYSKVSIQDFGVGIALAQQKLIFEQFYQVKNTSVKPASGLGIGLYICQQIIENHFGQIGVESQPGEGSTFWFTLPNAKPSI